MAIEQIEHTQKDWKIGDKITRDSIQNIENKIRLTKEAISKENDDKCLEAQLGYFYDQNNYFYNLLEDNNSDLQNIKTRINSLNSSFSNFISSYHPISIRVNVPSLGTGSVISTGAQVIAFGYVTTRYNSKNQEFINSLETPLDTYNLYTDVGRYYSKSFYFQIPNYYEGLKPYIIISEFQNELYEIVDVNEQFNTFEAKEPPVIIRQRLGENNWSSGIFYGWQITGNSHFGFIKKYS